jgi:hypothetical protein
MKFLVIVPEINLPRNLFVDGKHPHPTTLSLDYARYLEYAESWMEIETSEIGRAHGHPQRYSSSFQQTAQTVDLDISNVLRPTHNAQFKLKFNGDTSFIFANAWERPSDMIVTQRQGIKVGKHKNFQ